MLGRFIHGWVGYEQTEQLCLNESNLNVYLQ